MTEIVKIVGAVWSTAKTIVQFPGVGPILTFLGIVSAWVFPLLREQRHRSRQDDVTIRGLLLYFEVLKEKVDSIIKIFEDLQAAKDRLQEIRNQLGAPIRDVENDQRVVKQSALVNKLMYYTSTIGPFEIDNQKNHDAIERLFVSSELSNTDQRSALLAFIKYFKGSKPMAVFEDYQRYKEQLRAVLNSL
jgi:hypothetical protein